ncbi:MAG: metal ABC transporter ATP-binding protein [Demequina sp.]
MIAAEGLDVSFSGNAVLHDVSMSLDRGETLAVLGPNGSGKSTLVRALLGVVPHSAGTVNLFGTALGRRVPWERIGYVPQRVTATGGVSASASEVVTSGLLNGRRILPPRGAKQRVLAALDTMGVADRAHDPVNTLSGGQQQRVLIARALVREPDLLVLDEPVAGVDIASQAAFAEALRVMKSAGASVIIVLHETGTLASLVDRALVLDQGCKVHDGEPPFAHGVHALPGHDHVHPHKGEEASRPSLSYDYRTSP